MFAFGNKGHFWLPNILWELAADQTHIADMVSKLVGLLSMTSLISIA